VNRHERRRQAAFERGAKLGLAGDPEYIRVIEALAYAYREAVERYPDREPPRFAFPPKEIMVIGDLEPMIPRVARNESARHFLGGIIQGARASGDPKAFPTVFMLRVALEAVGAAIEVVSVADFGIAVGGRDN
jgi:hypothetical protein